VNEPRALPFPVTVPLICNWVASLGGRVKPATMKSYITGLRSLHVDMGLPTDGIFDHPRLQRIIHGARRFHGEAGTRERLPITRDVLLKILQCLPRWRTDSAQANLYAAFCLAFAGFLRVGEFTWSNHTIDNPLEFARWHLTWRSVAIQADRLLLTLPTSKTDPFRHGVTLTIAPSSDPACPLAAIQNLLSLRMADRHAEFDPLQPLFARPNNKPFSREYVVGCLRLCLTHQGIPGHYSGHSFRRGAATSARLAGLSDHEIQLLGRWRSDAYKRYIEVHPDQLLGISRRLQATGTAVPQARSQLRSLSNPRAAARAGRLPAGTPRG
jgi:integrase